LIWSGWNRQGYSRIWTIGGVLPSQDLGFWGYKRCAHWCCHLYYCWQV